MEQFSRRKRTGVPISFVPKGKKAKEKVEEIKASEKVNEMIP